MNKIDGRYLKDLRIKNGYSLREFAELIYTSKSSLQRWENSYLPENQEVLARIAQVCNLSVEQMREESERLYGEVFLSAEQAAEIKFGVKWLPIPIALLFIILVIFMIF